MSDDINKPTQKLGQIIRANTGKVTQAPEGFFSRNEKHADEYEDTDINFPVHYHKGGIDVIGFAEKQFSEEERRGFYRISALKYVTRFQDKGAPVKDLNKAKFFIDKLIDLEMMEEGKK